MSDWYLSPPLVTLRNEANRAYPNRAKVSDGSVGDLSHQARTSDHNPDRTGANQGEVRAIDVTQWDPGTPLNPRDDVAEALVNHIIKTRDPRLKYMIWRGRIMSGSGGPSPWVWRIYTGPNGHFHHVHISVKEGSKDGAWGFVRPGKTSAGTKPRQWLPMGKGDTDESISAKRGMEYQVSEAQLILKALSIRWRAPELDPGAVDGEYGERTARATEAFQKRHAKFLKDVGHPDYSRYWRGPFTGYTGGRTIAAERWWNAQSA